MVEGEVPDTRYTVTDSGWSTSAVFEGWFFELFLAYAPAKRPILLIMDGHSTHHNPAVIKTAAQEEIIVFLLPPSTTHLLQPLDRSRAESSLDNRLSQFQCENGKEVRH